MQWRKVSLHVILFLATVVSTTFAGVQWLNRDPFELANFSYGLSYAVLILAFLLAHEFGHYIAARLHGVDSSLPYFLPFPSFVLGLAPFGTLGAVIRIKTMIPSRKALLDIGSAGPLSGFVVCLAMLIVGFLTLPPIEYLYGIHPEYRALGQIPQTGLTFGRNLLVLILANLTSANLGFVPPMNEIYHYPLLCVGWFGTFVTSLNLLPVGQLDGGHISFAMFGSTYHRIAQVTLLALMALGTLGLLPLLGISLGIGWTGWIIWALILSIMIRSSKFRHQSLSDEAPLNPSRRWIGWLSYGVFALTFIPSPIWL